MAITPEEKQKRAEETRKQGEQIWDQIEKERRASLKNAMFGQEAILERLDRIEKKIDRLLELQKGG